MFSDRRGEGGRPAEDWGGGWGSSEGHVLLLSHVALGTVTGEW